MLCQLQGVMGVNACQRRLAVIQVVGSLAKVEVEDVDTISAKIDTFSQFSKFSEEFFPIITESSCFKRRKVLLSETILTELVRFSIKQLKRRKVGGE